jgi:hypothetical protein
MSTLLLLLALPAVVHAAPSPPMQWDHSGANTTGYIVHRRFGAGVYQELARVPVPTRTYTDPTLPVGNPICYRVYAYNATEVSAPSNERCLPLEAPTNLR